MKKYYVDFEYVDVYYYTMQELNEKLARELGSQCFGLRKSMGECTIKLEETDKETDLKDITIISNGGDYNIFKNNEIITNTAWLD